MQIVSLLCKRPHESNIALTECVVLSFKFELGESILKQLIISIYFIHFVCYKNFALNQNTRVQ